MTPTHRASGSNPKRRSSYSTGADRPAVISWVLLDGGCHFSWKIWLDQLPISNNNKKQATAAPKTSGNPCSPCQQHVRYPRLLQTSCSGSD